MATRGVTTKNELRIAAAQKTKADPRWRRVLARDASANGEFYYSVKTSDVYCLPSCASRPALPENIAFHKTQAEAIKAGFRACKRCKPDQFRHSQSNTIVPERKVDMKEKLLYTISPTCLGQTLVATSDKGVCAVLLDNNQKNLIADFKGRFPAADIERDDQALEPIAKKVVRSIENPAIAFTGKLDTRGSEFQESVWKALLEIPTGKTASYGDVARTLNKPGAVRAVAGACAANAIAVLIPCHRVVKSDGGISGYRWGVERKRQLLQMEGVK